MGVMNLVYELEMGLNYIVSKFNLCSKIMLGGLNMDELGMGMLVWMWNWKNGVKLVQRSVGSRNLGLKTRKSAEIRLTNSVHPWTEWMTETLQYMS